MIDQLFFTSECKQTCPASTAKQVSQMTANAPLQSTVLEFTCLWTLNKTQKCKSWNDGTLRFHQFNRRAMVYDDHRRLIVYLPGPCRPKCAYVSRRITFYEITRFHVETNLNLIGSSLLSKMVPYSNLLADTGSIRDHCSGLDSSISEKEQPNSNEQ